jgi:hypothetical protein
MAMDSLILDARGNPFVGTIDTIGGETFTDARAATVTLSALNAEVLMDIQGKTTAQYYVSSAAAVLTYLWEGTIDGTNYFALPAFANFQLLAAAAVGEQYIPSVTVATTTSGYYTVGCDGLRRVRLRVSAFTSGSIVVAARATSSDHIIYARQIPSTLFVTATAAANTAATASLPAAGAGLFHYITNINITRNATAALAGTATIIHTSTNLPGTPAWSVGNAMAAGGTQIDLDYTPTTPLKSLVANTATTVVAAAGGLAVLGRVNVSYYVGQ